MDGEVGCAVAWVGRGCDGVRDPVRPKEEVVPLATPASGLTEAISEELAKGSHVASRRGDDPWDA